ncbi:MAG: hypothetical protein FJZ89_13385 [Chloroflexi bacterium]|nr:hypothetical protein [Chloroflexota bacterium]
MSDTQLVECPNCEGEGVLWIGATVGMWQGLVPFKAIPEKCDFCNGYGMVDPASAAEWARDELEVEEAADAPPHLS